VLSSNVLVWIKKPMVLSTLKSNITIEEDATIQAPEVVYLHPVPPPPKVDGSCASLSATTQILACDGSCDGMCRGEDIE
jgi:hypothetical protein